MSWDFETEPEFQAKLDWADAIVRDDVEPLVIFWTDVFYTPHDDT
jgi:acyl-CoA dehydrogenase